MTRRACAAPTSACSCSVASLCSRCAPAWRWPHRSCVRVVLGPQWDLAATVVPWFALAAGFSVISALSQTVAEARADLNRSLVVQGAYVVVLGVFLAFAIGYRSYGIWVFAAAVARRRAPPARRLPRPHAAHRRAHHAAQLWASYAPAAFASARRRVGRRGRPARALLGQVPTLLVFAAELAAGALALALCIRFCPLPGIRRELRMRLDRGRGARRRRRLRWRLAPLVVGRPESAPERCRDRAAAARVGAAGRRGRYRGGRGTGAARGARRRRRSALRFAFPGQGARVGFGCTRV